VIQQVNLYQPQLKKAGAPFSAAAILIATAAVVVGIGLLYAFMAWQIRGLEAAARAAEQQQLQAQARLARATRELVRREDPRLVAEVEQLEDLLNVSEKLLELLRTGEFGNREGYAEYLLALSRQHVPGVWLTGLDIRGDGAFMQLQGRSNAPELVPRYLQQLGRERVMSGITFGVFKMQRPALSDADGAVRRSPAFVEFQVATGEDES
jgi:MSHA biogenesis protein MshI